MFCKRNRWLAYMVLTGLLVGGLSPALNAITPTRSEAGCKLVQSMGCDAPHGLNQLTQRNKNITYNPPNRGAPGQTQDAGSRPSCPTADIPFTAIAPATNWGETLSPRPTFWLYLPYTASTVELTLYDEGNQQGQVYHTTFQTADTAGLAQFSLPDNAPALESDRLYRWQFTFVCDAETQSYFQVTGVIVRRSPTPELTAQLQAASPDEHIALLAAQGFWYDAVHQLNQQRRLDPGNETLQSDWQALIQHPVVGLDALGTVPLMDCCSE